MNLQTLKKSINEVDDITALAIIRERRNERMRAPVKGRAKTKKATTSKRKTSKVTKPKQVTLDDLAMIRELVERGEIKL